MTERKVGQAHPREGPDQIRGGFYCGKVDGIYMMNGFYMAMRAAFCAPGENIRWFTVSWPADGFSWADFRGGVLGATDPAAAPVGSIRRTILDRYRQLGLQSRPDLGFFQDALNNNYLK